MMKQSLKFAIYLLLLIGSSSSHAGSYDDFFQAIIRDHAGGVHRLLEAGIDPNSRDPNGMPALMVALRRESPRSFDVLLAHPAIDVDAANDVGETALMLAALAGDLDISRRLLDRGARVQRPGWSPIHYAASGPSTELTRQLLDLGATVDAVAPNGTTPLMLAAQLGPEATVTLLLERGADPRRRNQRGLQALDFAESGGRAFMVDRFQKLPR